MTNSGDWDETYHYYYDGQRMIETRNSSDLPRRQAGEVLKQYVWGTQYARLPGQRQLGGQVDELAQIGINQDPGNASSGSTLENLCERFFYPLQDANFNVLGVVSAVGELVERYEYTPYGRRTIYSNVCWMVEDMNDDGVVDGQDFTIWKDDFGSGPPESRADLNGDGIVDGQDWTIHKATFGNSLPLQEEGVYHPRLESFRLDSEHVDCEATALCDVGHQGLLHDREFGLIYNRARYLSPTLCRFLQRDPVGYEDGMCLYQYVQGTPVNRLDPSGLTTVIWTWAPRAAKSVKITTNWCCPSEDKIIKQAVEAAYDAANSSYSDVWDWRNQPRGWTGAEARTDTRIKNFFWNGWQAAVIPDGQKLTILEVLRKSRDALADIGFSCGGTAGFCATGGNAASWTDYGSKGGDLLLCSKFFYGSWQTRRSRAETILHEVTHAWADTVDAGAGFDRVHIHSTSGGIPWYQPYTKTGGVWRLVPGGYRGMKTDDRLKHADTYSEFMMLWY